MLGEAPPREVAPPPVQPRVQSASVLRSQNRLGKPAMPGGGGGGSGGGGGAVVAAMAVVAVVAVVTVVSVVRWWQAFGEACLSVGI